MDNNDNNKLVITLLITNTLLDLAIISAAVFLSVHTNNYNWMWLLCMILVTGYSYRQHIKKD